MVKYDDVKNQSTEDYFNNNIFSVDAFKKKYANDSETYVKSLHRVCKYAASAEKTKELQEYWEERWFDEIYNGFFHPAGSIMQGAGVNSKISLMNCTHIGLLDDSLECLFNYTEYRVAKTAAYRQGLGIHFDKIRPAKSTVNNSSKESQGVIHWMKKMDGTAYYIGQKGRIPAMLMSLSVTHPDVIDFIKVKSDYTTIQNANISVHINNKFYKCVENDKDWTMEFTIPEVKIGDKIYLDSRWNDIRLADGEDDIGYYTIAKFSKNKEVIQKTEKAVKILELIAKMMHSNAEPGIQNIDIARKYSNSDAVGFPIVGTNACCVTSDTKVMTERGWLSIEDIVKLVNSGEKLLIMSYNEDSNIYELKPLLNVFQQRTDVTVTLEIEEDDKIYKIECSSDHKILTRNRGYIEASSLLESDDIVIFK